MKRKLLLFTCLMVLSFTGCNDSDKNNQDMEDTKPIEKEDVDDSETVQVTTDTEQTIEVSDYFQEPSNFRMGILMQKTVLNLNCMTIFFHSKTKLLIL